jgi:nucleoside-diphosphate-sugar epimerase
MSSDVAFITDEKRKRPKQSEVYRLCCDNKKVKEFVGYSPEISIQEGLKKTIDWMLKPENLINYKTDIYNV